MKKLFVLVLMTGVCTASIMAQEAPDVSKAGVTDIHPSLRFEISDTDKQDGKGRIFNSSASTAVTGGSTQCPPRCPSSDRTKVEIYAGYSFLRFDRSVTNNDDINDFLRDQRNFHGVDISGTFNFSRFVGAQIDFSFHKKSDDFVNFGSFTEADASIQNYLFGVQVKDNSIDGPWLRPYGHFLVGFSRQKLEFEAPGVGNDLEFRRNSFAMAMGGGIDIRLTDNISVRAVKFDYLPVFVNDFASQGVIFDGRTQNNFRAGAGLVFKF